MIRPFSSLPEALEALRNDRLERIEVQHNEYCEVKFGPAGRLVAALEREGLPILAAALASESSLYFGGGEDPSSGTITSETKPPKRVRSPESPEGPSLPLRLRDYGLLILAAMRGERPGFGPGTPYERRDALYHQVWHTI